MWHQTWSFASPTWPPLWLCFIALCLTGDKPSTTSPNCRVHMHNGVHRPTTASKYLGIKIRSILEFPFLSALPKNRGKKQSKSCTITEFYHVSEHQYSLIVNGQIQLTVKKYNRWRLNFTRWWEHWRFRLLKSLQSNLVCHCAQTNLGLDGSILVPIAK